MKASVILFAGDLEDEGHDVVLERIAATGADAVTLAGNYHHSRDVFPHNPRRSVRYLRGEVEVRPAPDRFAGGEIQPPLSEAARTGDPLAALLDAARARDLAVRVWTNSTHTTRLASAYPGCAVRNCFGDRVPFALCPAHPEVRRYLRALHAELASRPIAGMLLETLGFLPFDHGWHHERSYVPLTSLVKLVLSLCLCEHCAAAGGVDGDRLATWAAGAIRAELAGKDSPLAGVPVTPDAVGALAGGAMGDLLAGRAETVRSLFAVIAADAGGVPVAYMDMSGGVRGVGGGMEVEGDEPTAPARSWQDGAALTALAADGRHLSMLGYAHEDATVARDLEAYLGIVSPDRLSVALRALAPDCMAPGDLAGKVRRLADAGVAWVDFYHYGFMPLEHLDWIRAALAQARG